MTATDREPADDNTMFVLNILTLIYIQNDISDYQNPLCDSIIIGSYCRI